METKSKTVRLSMVDIENLNHVKDRTGSLNENEAIRQALRIAAEGGRK